MMQINNAYNFEKMKVDKMLWFFLLLIMSLLLKSNELDSIMIIIIFFGAGFMTLVGFNNIESNIKQISKEMKKIMKELE
jgi:hypothetical protein